MTTLKDYDWTGLLICWVISLLVLIVVFNVAMSCRNEDSYTIIDPSPVGQNSGAKYQSVQGQ